ncbi:autotransporter outer membrane beta-barrel domain-containing protein [Pseudomonas sp. Irchel s3h14]|uniref:autotransporter outer membrane beta-barrel domain-containing protein n=1 Tax=Pseudomonas sp. Irchel s3h14 TaxID=2009179 RepID=UPI002113BF44|nr:autotransporter outer membrane beta-barrel domain-containing protein [Pseudomonas sp. Irchel s3h14]
MSLVLNSSLIQAATVPAGTTQSIDSTTPLENWQLEANAVLTGSGAATLGITSSAGGVIDLTNSTVTSAGEGGFAQGIFLTNASAMLSHSTVTSVSGIGISAVRNVSSIGGSQVTLRNNSVVRGLQGGIAGNRFSEINVQNSTVEGTGANSFGIRLLEGSLSASGSTITGGLNGLIVGTDTQASAIIPTTIVLDSTRVEGQSGSAIVVGFNAPNFPTVANIQVRNGSSLIAGNGTLLEVGPGASAGFLVDNSHLTGNVVVAAGSSANVTLQNNASLTGDLQNVTSATLNNQARMTGNVLGASNVVIDNGSAFTGNLQEVANATINNQSVMTGNVTAAAGSVAGLTVDNGASLTGQVSNVTNFSINNNALWQMTDSQSVNNLTLNNGGRVRLGGNQDYFQLNVANLAGRGLFEMGADFNKGISDLLNVTGSAAGNHQLLVTGTGLDPVNDSSIKVVQSVAGSAQYGLVNERVDVGAFTYRLVKEGDDWYLQPDKEVVSTTTRAVMAISAVAPTVIYGETVLLNNRMGDLRVNGGQTGGWVRSFGSRYSISNNAYGNGYSQDQYGFSMGVDTPVQIAGERVLMGVFAGYSKSNLDLSRGSSGEIDSTSIGLYGTWLGDSGYYLDTVAKLNHFRNDAKVTMSDGRQTEGHYNNLGASASVEFGKHIDIKDGYYAEVFTQWQAASVQGKDFSLDNGLKADADTTRSMLGKAGVTLGRGMTLSNGSVLQPHIRAAFVHEFVKNNEVRVNDNKFNNDLSGSRFEVGAGGSWTLNDRWQLHAELDTSKGDSVTKDFGVNMGAHYAF